MRLEDTLPGAGRGARFREMQFTGDGLVLGEGTVLAKMNDEGLCVDEERVLTCLAVAFGPEVPPAAIGALRRAAKCWRSGDKALAAIHLAQIGLRKIDGEDAYRLRLAARLIDGGMRPRDLARELGLGKSSPTSANIATVSRACRPETAAPAGNGWAAGRRLVARTRRWLKGDRRPSASTPGRQRRRNCHDCAGSSERCDSGAAAEWQNNR